MRRTLGFPILACCLIFGDRTLSENLEAASTEDDSSVEESLSDSIEVYNVTRELTEIESSRYVYQDEAFHVPTNSCYSTGSQGPCNLFESWFAASEDSDEGECYCKYTPWGWSDVNQPIARSTTDNRCYSVYSQADCSNKSDWFVAHPTREGFGHCEPNPCLKVSTEGSIYVNKGLMLRILYRHETDDMNLEIEPFWFTHMGKCVQTFTLGTCGPPGGNHTLFFRGTDPTPICVDTETARYSLDSYCFFEFNQFNSEVKSLEVEDVNDANLNDDTATQNPQQSKEDAEQLENEDLDDPNTNDDTEDEDQSVERNVTIRSHCNFNGALHLPSNICYETNGRGPCNPFEMWERKSRLSKVGKCVCLVSTGEKPFVNQPISRSVVDNRCYPVFSQGDCLRSDEWFVQHPNKTGFGHCEPNPCIHLSTEGFNYVPRTAKFILLGDDGYMRIHNKTIIPEDPFWFLHEGKCIQTFRKGACGPSGSNHTMFFVGTESLPGCTYPACDIKGENFVCRDLLESNCVDVGAAEPTSRTNSCPRGFIMDSYDCSYNATVPVDDLDY